ncbi:hypothetical protein EET67_06555 [Pseudaminobacter arsenicus]|uniref:DUF4148 domain-containing protein n=1 Tax=Borborobacter arsenicus TaxID=1851146 RepID=A0A432V990_9HYPH|nr:hypothetical protein [Pseudaminobacter arsenicus]RUM98758.1 hypothetical protein EET67_06555 [Pseudaminobacter arsenicus]
MKNTVLAFTALMMTSGMAFAQSAAYPAHADAAPASVVVNQPTSVDYSSTASVTATVGATNLQERATIIQQRADNR